ncbi:TIGRB bisphosphatase, partial [Amia calva]|nr:TIGRB bisphosphatase [Amia calva]
MGVKQAEAAGQYLKDVKFTNVFSSDLQRAKQTAAIIMRSNNHSPGITIICDPRLRERCCHPPLQSFGIAEGKPVNSMKEMAKAAGQQCPHFTPPGGETQDQVRSRAKEFIRSLCQRMASEHLACSGPESTDGPPPSACEGDACPPCSSATNSCNHPADGALHLAAHALVVSHGTYMRNVVKHFVEDLDCALPHSLKMSQMFSACPNTGMCRFILTLERNREVAPSAECVFINRKDHLASLREDE